MCVECKIGRQIGAVAAVMLVSYWIIVVKRELSRKAELTSLPVDQAQISKIFVALCWALDTQNKYCEAMQMLKSWLTCKCYVCYVKLLFTEYLKLSFCIWFAFSLSMNANMHCILGINERICKLEMLCAMMQLFFSVSLLIFLQLTPLPSCTAVSAGSFWSEPFTPWSSHRATLKEANARATPGKAGVPATVWCELMI